MVCKNCLYCAYSQEQFIADTLRDEEKWFARLKALYESADIQEAFEIHSMKLQAQEHIMDLCSILSANVKPRGTERFSDLAVALEQYYGKEYLNWAKCRQMEE